MRWFASTRGFPALTRAAVVVVSAALVVTVGPAVDVSLVAAADAVAPAAATTTVTERPDVVSAQIAARTQESRVEVTGARTESSTTFVNADGTVTVEASQGAVRVRRGEGWVPVDMDLAKTAGGWAPKASPVPVTFTAGGKGVAATVSGEAQKSLAMSWEANLPAPTVKGSTATYALSANTDFVLRATPEGFEQSVVLKAAPTSAPRVRLPLTLKNLALKATVNGGFDALDANGKAEFSVRPPVMYSAARDPETEEPTQVQPLGAALSDDGAGGQRLDLSAAMAFLKDPKTVYPVTIDPVIASASRYGDTWIINGNATPKVSDYRLAIGLIGANPARALLRFDETSYLGNHVTSATLKLRNYAAVGCTGQTVTAYPVSSAYNNNTVIWAGQPSVDTTAAYKATASFSYGDEAAGCPNNYGGINVTNMVSAWSFGTIPNSGIELRASETDTAQRKYFCSMNLDTTGTTSCTSTAFYPTLSITYNSYPWDPHQVTASPQVKGSNGTTYVTSVTPTLQAKIGNTDGTNVSVQGQISYDPNYPGDGTGDLWSGAGPASSPNSLAGVNVGTALTTGKHYRYRVRGGVVNGSGGTDTGPWSAYTSFTADTSPPSAPTIACTTYPANAWTNSSAASTCTLDTTSTDGSGYWWGLDNPSPDTLLDDSSNSGAPLTVSITPGEGQHILYAKSRDVALNASTATATYTFGVGNGGVLTPVANDTTQKAVGLSAQSSSARTQVTYSYRPGTDTSLPWITVPPVNVTAAGSTTAIAAWPQTATVSGALASYPQLNWNAAATITAAGGTDGAIQVRACFTQAGANPWCSGATTFLLAKTDFAASAATSPIGPGAVSLTSGNFNVGVTDVSGGLTIARTHTSLVPAAVSSGPDGVFGAGWRIAAFGPDDGAGGLTLIDTSARGYVTVKDSTGTEYVYNQNGSVFTGTGDANDGSTLARSSTISNPLDPADPVQYTGWQLTDDVATVTTFLPTISGNTTYVSKWVDGGGAEDVSGYVRDAVGRVTKIMAPTPDGVTCTTMVAGCQALTLTYASATTATGTLETAWGDYTGLVKAITSTAYDPATSAMVTTTVASYLYDSTGHLRAEWDPRISPALKTRYNYDGNGRLSTYAAAGRAAWSMAYDSTGRLADVSRTDPANGLAKQSVVYDIAVSGTGMPMDLSSAQTTTWNQTIDLPYSGAAVFPASRVPATGAVNGVSGVHTPSAADWPYASLAYMDVSGRVVNSAAYGGGAWQIDSTRYDANNNTVWHLSAGNRARALTRSGLMDPYTAAQASSSVRADLLATISTYSSDGIELRTTLGPAHQLHLASGAWASVRVQNKNTYDEGAPDAAAYHLVTTTATASVPLDGTATTAADSRKVLTGYDPIDGASATGDTSGWILYSPTSVTTVMGATPTSADIIRKTRYDDAGRTVESRMPESNGTDAGTTTMTYYTADASSPVAACRSKPQWAGSVCRTAPFAQPTGSTIPSTLATYSKWGTPVTTVETTGTTTRTTMNTYDPAGRLVTTSVAVLPAADGGAAVPTTTTAYDAATGDATTWTASGVGISAGFNTLGQQTSYTDADGNISSSTYTIDGQPKTRNDAKGTYTYTYDGTDAAGQVERRGLITSLNVGMGSLPSTFTAAYDNDGRMTKKTYPNGIIAATTYDDAGVPRSLHYTNRGSNWMFYDQGFDRDNHAVWSTGPNTETHYGYDNNNRLTNVEDTVLGQCTTHQYGFSKNGNRTSLTTGLPSSDGACQTSTTTTTSSIYDTVDRDTAGGYTYDRFGRATSTPSSQVTGGAALSIGYYSDDKVASLTQGAKSKSFTLDPARRLRQATDTTSGAEDRRIINHYSSSADSPTWIASSSTAGSTWAWQRNVTGIDGGLAALQDSSGAVQIQLANLHGDIVATVDDDPNALSTSSYFESTEYGAPRTENATTSPRYGWLGTAQRSADALAGVMIMGVRLYNPTSGRFLSRDPVEGGNDNSYAYPNNPIGETDLTGLCNDHTVSCMRKVLTTSEPWPSGFLNYIKGHGGARYAWTKAGMRAMKTGGDHCSGPGVRDTGFAFNFINACDTHDLGYMIMRFWRVGGDIRKYVDRLFLNDMGADCASRSFLNKMSCRETAASYYAFIAGVSRQSHYRAPGW
jgi:RHS repeat-associated protein